MKRKQYCIIKDQTFAGGDMEKRKHLLFIELHFSN